MYPHHKYITDSQIHNGFPSQASSHMHRGSLLTHTLHTSPHTHKYHAVFLPASQHSLSKTQLLNHLPGPQPWTLKWTQWPSTVCSDCSTPIPPRSIACLACLASAEPTTPYPPSYGSLQEIILDQQLWRHSKHTCRTMIPEHCRRGYNISSIETCNSDYLLFCVFVIQMGQINQRLPHNLHNHIAISHSKLQRHTLRTRIEDIKLAKPLIQFIVQVNWTPDERRSNSQTADRSEHQPKQINAHTLTNFQRVILSFTAIYQNGEDIRVPGGGSNKADTRYLILNKNVVVFHGLTYDVAILVLYYQDFLWLSHATDHKQPQFR